MHPADRANDKQDHVRPAQRGVGRVSVVSIVRVSRMKQHTSTFQGVLRKLEAWENPHVESCERRAKRYTVRCEARLTCEMAGNSSGSTDQIVQVRDISRSGAGLLCSSPVESGTRWRLQPMIDGVAVADMPAFCRYSRKVEDGVYLIGVEFGIETAIMIALGVPVDELRCDETAGSNHILRECQFVDPSEVIREDAA